jgi:hypothetical protein
VIPELLPSGELPPGVHPATWDEITSRYGLTRQRRRLLVGLLEAAHILKTAGSRWLLINGSFVTSKPRPADIDVCYDDKADQGKKEQFFESLYRLEPVFFDFQNGRKRQKERFGCEFFPESSIADPITGKTYREFFQFDRNDEAKGILLLDLVGLITEKEESINDSE